MSSPGFLRFSAVSWCQYMPVSRTACSFSGLGAIWPGVALEADVEPVADLLAFALGHAEHARDHLDRERRGEVGDGVELVASFNGSR